MHTNPSTTLEARAVQLLRQALDRPEADFRPSQLDAIHALVAERRRLLVVQRTGWGKSMVYFLATRFLRDEGRGPTLLISPLLALMRNQIEAAERIGIRAETINSTNQDAWDEVRARLERNEVDILLISPERLANDRFREQMLMPVAGSIGLFVVDEAHCISDWGHDFRPDYRRITRILQALPANVPVLATTATANDRVVEDVQSQLGPGLETLRGPLARESLRLQNIDLDGGQASRLAWLAQTIPQLPGSGIVYTLTIRDANRVAFWLRSQGIAAESYSASLDNVDRIEREQALLKNDLKALVATSALGMGFDKPDLGFVIHFQRPSSVVHYYQQVGRAGRAIETAYGVLLSGKEDDEITDYFIQNAFPPRAHIREVLEALDKAEDGLSIPMLERHVNLGRNAIDKTLKILATETPSPVVKDGPRWYTTPINYEPDEGQIEALKKIRFAEQAEMGSYMQSSQCLMNFLRRALDDPHAEPCGICASCRGEPLLTATVELEMANRAVTFLRRSDLPIPPRKQWPPGDVFPTYGWRGRISADLLAEEGRALCLWGDAGWGYLVRQGIENEGRLSQDLVEAVAELVDQRWRPDPGPTWLTVVPSHSQPELLPDFALRLAQLLNLPFESSLTIERPARPQSEMRNSFQQARNLDGVFAVVKEKLPGGPVLLLDDRVDSRWTLTVAAALLRKQGVEAVFPVALANSSVGGA